MTMKYRTLAELAAAYDCGELSAPLVVDNDSSYVYVDETQVFGSGGPAVLIKQALDLLGIPHDEP